MRVTGGTLVGRRFAVPRGTSVRPTADRVRESLFARLEVRGHLEGARVLDLYAGSGALGIEALSRGAARVVFVDRAGACVAQIRRSLASLGVAERATLERASAPAAVRRRVEAGERFDLVLADPPYGTQEAERVLDAVAGSGLLAPGGALVLEVSRRHAPGARPGLREADAWRYGDTLVVRYVEGRHGAGAGPDASDPETSPGTSPDASPARSHAKGGARSP